MTKPGKRPRLLHAPKPVKKGQGKGRGTKNIGNAFDAVCLHFRIPPGGILWKLVEEKKIGREFQKRPLLRKGAGLVKVGVDEWYAYVLREGIGEQAEKMFLEKLGAKIGEKKPEMKQVREKTVTDGRKIIALAGKEIRTTIFGTRVSACRMKDSRSAIIVWGQGKGKKQATFLYSVSLKPTPGLGSTYSIFDYRAGASIQSVGTKREIYGKLTQLFRKFFP